MAATVDGKTADVARRAPHFGAADADHLERLCAGMDALVMGAGTLRAYGSTRTILKPELITERIHYGWPQQPLSVIISGSGNLDPNLPFFTRQRVPRAVATLAERVASVKTTLGDLAEVWGCSDLGESRVAPEAVLARLARRGARRVALLGGGATNVDWFNAGVVDAIELTIAPSLFGGALAPTLLDGPGLPTRAQLTLLDYRREEDCLFLRYRVAQGALHG